MPSRWATDDEIARWRTDGWVLVDGLVSTDEIDEAVADLRGVFPRPEKFHADPQRYTPPGRSTEELRRGYPPMPEHGPAFRPEQHRWAREFPFLGSGALNRMFVHPSIVDFCERALDTRALRIYQHQVNARYQGDADYEQPMHTDRNHSFLPPAEGPPFWHVEMFLYLTDVEADTMPTHVVSRRDSAGRSVNDVLLPADDPELYTHERAAVGRRGSLLAYRSDVFHRAVDMTRPGGVRFLLNTSYRDARADWVGYHVVPSKATHPGWVQFVETATPRELELFGFPPPGHPVWTDALLDATTQKYPRLDVTPWRRALRR